ncbi:hypothetical protein [Janthinobacterium lividum]
MGFAEKFVASLQSSNLRDDAFHHDLDAIAAAALAGDLGSLLCRVKYADGTINRLFEGNSGNLAQLLRIWTAAVTEKGKARRWVKINSERDVFTAHALYKRVAHASLAPWLLGSMGGASAAMALVCRSGVYVAALRALGAAWQTLCVPEDTSGSALRTW